MFWAWPLQYKVTAARSFVTFPWCCWAPSALAKVWDLIIRCCGHPHPHRPECWLSHCSQLLSISLSGNYGDCGGRQLSQAPSVSSPDLLPSIAFCNHFMLLVGILKVAPPWFHGGSATKVPSFFRPWHLIWSTSTHLEFQPRKRDSPLRDFSYIWLSSLLSLFL